jgi:hypothetical protein
MATEISSLTEFSAPGVYTMKTKTGSTYEIVINPDGSSTSKRLPAAGEDHVLRHDNEAWSLHGQMIVNIGYPAIFELEPMGEPPLTVRRTSVVTEIHKIS